MKLGRESGTELRIETRAELERAVEDLGRADDAFAVLTRDDGAFAQAAGSRSGFVFEVVEDGKGAQSRRADLSHEEVVALFASWLDGDDRWRTAIEWGPGPDDPASGARGGWIALKQRHALFVLAAAVAVAGIGEWRRQTVRDVVTHLQEATAQVVSVGVRKKAPRYAVAARFMAGARWITVKEAVRDAPAIGARVAVWYDPRDPDGTASLLNGNRYGLAVALYFAAVVIALAAAKVSRDIARREAREAAGGGAGPGPSRAELDTPRRRMIRE